MLGETKIQEKLLHTYEELSHSLSLAADSMDSLREYFLNNPEEASYINDNIPKEMGCIEYQISKISYEIFKAKNQIENLYETKKGNLQEENS